MARPPLSLDERDRLSVAPPLDQHGAPVVWQLRDREIREVVWQNPITHVELVLEQLDVAATQWKHAAFERSTLRELVLHRVTFAHARFEDVVFERCRFESSTFEACTFTRCRFVDCRFEFVTFLRCELRELAFTRLTTTVLDLREGRLAQARFDACALEGLRATKLQIDGLALHDGRLVGGDLTACTISRLDCERVTLDGLRVLDSRIDTATFCDAPVQGLSFGGCDVDELSLRGCTELFSFHVISSRVDRLVLDGCPRVAGLLFADGELHELLVRACEIDDSAFERMQVNGRARFEGGVLRGVLFVEGRWLRLELDHTALLDYVAARSTHFESLQLAALSTSTPLDLRLAGETYGAGSMTWSAAHGP